MKKNKFKSTILTISVLVLAAVLTGCAKSEPITSCLSGHTYGFLGGLWHGFIAPFDFIAMLFNNKIAMYAQNNNGGFYALGFLLGSGGWGFFGGKGIKRVQHTHTHTHVNNNDRFDNAEIV
jgi:hypothetical protein